MNIGLLLNALATISFPKSSLTQVAKEDKKFILVGKDNEAKLEDSKGISLIISFNATILLTCMM